MNDILKNVLLFRMGEMLCAIPLGSVSEVMRPLPYESFSDLPAFIAGVSLIRGLALPVVNLNKILGYEEINSQLNRFVVIKYDDTHLACLVDEVIGVDKIDTGLVKESPPLLSKAHPELIAGIGILDEKFLLVLKTLIQLPKEFIERLSKLSQEE
jgi:purine-binding chemotaxis protein CheW